MDSVVIGNIVISLAAIIVSVGIHEMMHAFVALRLGDDLAHSHGRISLNPLVHIDPILTIAMPLFFLLIGQPPILAAKPVPINTMRIRGGENGLALVGLAGPFTNLALAALAAIPLNLLTLGEGLGQVLLIFFSVNVSLFVFNMLPIPPLDGSRALYAIAPRPVQRVMEAIEAQGLLFIIVLIVVFGSFIGPVLSDGRQFVIDLLLR